MQGLHENVYQIFMETCNFLPGKKLGKIIIIHAILLMAFHIAQMDAKLFRLIAAVVPSSVKNHTGVLIFINHTVLIGQRNMEQSSILVRQIHNMGKRESLMTQKLIPGVHQFLIELIQTPFVLDFIIKGKGVDKHSAALLQRIAGTVKNRHAHRKAGSASDTPEIDGKSHIKDSKGGNSVVQTIQIDSMIEHLRKPETHPLSHRADRGTLHGFDDGRLPRFFHFRLPIPLILPISLSRQILLFLLKMQLIGRDFSHGRILSCKQGQICPADPVADQHLSPAIRYNMVKFDKKTTGAFAGAEKGKTIQGSIQNRKHLPAHRRLPTGDSLLICMGKIIDVKSLFFIRGKKLHRLISLQRNPGPQGRIGFQKHGDTPL